MRVADYCLAACLVAVILLTGSAAAQTASPVVLHTFSGSDGANPNTPLLKHPSGDLWGTTSGGGLWGYGSIFRVSRSGAFTQLYAFRGLGDGRWPQRLVLGSDGVVYGTTGGGRDGSSVFGTFFRIATSGDLTTLYVFSTQSGGYGPSDLMVGTDGFFYGVTAGGGQNGLGTAFRLDTRGQLTVLHAFGRAPSGLTDQTNGPFVQGADGSLYGTGILGLEKMTMSGDISVVRAFGGGGSLIVGRDGRIYGGQANGMPCDRESFFSFGPPNDFRYFASAGGASLCASFSLNFQAADMSIVGSVSGFDGQRGITVFGLTLDGRFTAPNSYPTFASSLLLTDGGDGQMYGAVSGAGGPDVGSIVAMRIAFFSPKPPTNVRIKPGS